MTKTFILGIGAPKAGTTWLHAYLKSVNGFAHGLQKEMHIWDAVYIPECRRYLVPRSGPVLQVKALLRREMQQDPEAYFAYIDELLSLEGATHAADITPSYAGLSGGQLRFIWNGLTARAIDTKIVFLMRDPVERCLSMLRMFRSFSLREVNHYLDFTKPDDQILMDYAQSENARVRTNYHRTMVALADSGIPSSQIYTGLYEEMFAHSQLETLSAFLGVPFRPEASSQKINAGDQKDPISDATRAQVVEHFRDVYEEMSAFLPATRTVWSGHKYLNGCQSTSNSHKK